MAPSSYMHTNVPIHTHIHTITDSHMGGGRGGGGFPNQMNKVVFQDTNNVIIRLCWSLDHSFFLAYPESALISLTAIAKQTQPNYRQTQAATTDPLQVMYTSQVREQVLGTGISSDFYHWNSRSPALGILTVHTYLLKGIHGGLIGTIITFTLQIDLGQQAKIRELWQLKNFQYGTFLP